MQSTCIKIGSRKYDIAIVDDETFDISIAERHQQDNENLIKSFVDYDDQIIMVRGSLHADLKRELVIHEILHACFEDSGVIDQDEKYESLIRILSPRISSLIIEQNLIKKLRNVLDI